MTKQEAIAEMQKGNKVTHKYFGKDEWATMGTEGQIILEDGVECHPLEFWRWRTDSYWNEGWELFNENKYQPPFKIRMGYSIRKKDENN